MDIISNKLIRRLEIEYDNTEDNSVHSRMAIHDYLDKEFGECSYRIKQIGAHPKKSIDIGLAIIEVTQKKQLDSRYLF